MKARYTVLAALAGFGIGAVTIDQLHAQAKPPVFYVAEIDMKNADAYQKEYAPKAQALIKKHGGKVLAAGQNITVIEGAPPKARGDPAVGQHREDPGLAQFCRVQGNTQDRRQVRDLPLLRGRRRGAAVIRFTDRGRPLAK